MKKTILLIFIFAFSMVAGQTKADFVFGEPENLGSMVNSSYWEGVFSISSDGLELYFGSDRSGGHGNWDIWITKRTSLTDPWGPPVNLEVPVNSVYYEGSPCISSDGLSLYFGSGRPGGSGVRDIYVTTRVTKDDPWIEPVNLGPIVNSSAYDHAPSISADGLSLFFDSNREKIGTAYSDACYIYMTTRQTLNDAWSVPVRLGPVVNPGIEFDSDYSRISEDGLSLYFSRFLPDKVELWVATRTLASDSWNRSINLGLLGVSPSFSTDSSTMYFSSTESGSYGPSDLFQISVKPVVDLNADGIVDAADMCMIVDNWGTNNSLCDIGPTPFGDGIVDIQDLVVLAEHLFEETTLVE